MDAQGQNTTGGVRHNRVLSALHFLKTAKAGFLDGLRYTLDTLAVDDPGTRLLISTVFFRTSRRICAFTRSNKPFAIHFV